MSYTSRPVSRDVVFYVVESFGQMVCPQGQYSEHALTFSVYLSQQCEMEQVRIGDATGKCCEVPRNWLHFRLVAFKMLQSIGHISNYPSYGSGMPSLWDANVSGSSHARPCENEGSNLQMWAQEYCTSFLIIWGGRYYFLLILKNFLLFDELGGLAHISFKGCVFVLMLNSTLGWLYELIHVVCITIVPPFCLTIP